MPSAEMICLGFTVNPADYGELTPGSMRPDIHFLFLIDMRLRAERRRIQRADFSIAHPHPAG